MACRKNAGRLGAGCISVCLDSETRWLGHYGAFYVPGWPCTREKERDMRAREFQRTMRRRRMRQMRTLQHIIQQHTMQSTLHHTLQHKLHHNNTHTTTCFTGKHSRALTHVCKSCHAAAAREYVTNDAFLIHEQPTPPRTDKNVWNTTDSWLVRVRQDSFVIHSCETWLIPDSFVCDMTHLWFGRVRPDSFVTCLGESFATQSCAIWLTVVDVVLRNLNFQWNLKLIIPKQH